MTLRRHRHALMTAFGAMALFFTFNALYWTDGAFRWLGAWDAIYYLAVFMWVAISEWFRP